MPTLTSSKTSTAVTAASYGRVMMRHLRFITLMGILAGIFSCNGLASEERERDQLHEKIIKDYFAGWEKKDWDSVASHLAEGFTFTSPAPDDHITIEQFRAKCWNQADHIKRFEFVKISGNEEAAFAIVHMITQDNRVIRNIEYFTFRSGKIQSQECFFGGTGLGFPTNQK